MTPPSLGTIRHLLEMQAIRMPEAAAIVAPERFILSYSALLDQVEQTANALNGIGISRNDPVAVVLPNGPEMAAAFVAIASVATCAPLNSAYQTHEFDFYLSDLQPKALIVQTGTNSAAIGVAQRHSIPIVQLVPGGDGSAGIFSLVTSAACLPTENGFAQEDDAALILYTSGTTARPKKVALTHSKLLASANSIAASLQLTAADRCLNVMPLFHVHGVIGALLSSMMAGASVVCAAGFDAEKFFGSLEWYQPTWYTAVPTIHQAILSRAKTNPDVIERHSLRMIRSCSAPLPAAIARELEDVFRVPVIEAYGMTEAGHQIASNPLPPRDRKAGSVGLPTGTEIAIMNGGGRILPAGEKGEIFIRGRSVISGYASALTDNGNFVDGWFRTGDLGYFDADGYLFLTGRLKEIINRGGEKISPKEIDEALLDHPDISQAAAFPLPHPTLGEDIAALIVAHEDAQVSEQSIREYLLDRMAEFKVPSRVLIVDQIPKTATGKVNRSQLAAQYVKEPPTSSTASELERMVANIYREVLSVAEISPGDNFFALGGDSVRATQVINRVRALFEVNLSIATIFRKATVPELAQEIVETLKRKN
jgi:acyl-CoA synthetase (AMP-forming)/AMP-acid ligase II/acyl carrier protein